MADVVMESESDDEFSLAALAAKKKKLQQKKAAATAKATADAGVGAGSGPPSKPKSKPMRDVGDSDSDDDFSLAALAAKRKLAKKAKKQKAKVKAEGSKAAGSGSDAKPKPAMPRFVTDFSRKPKVPPKPPSTSSSSAKKAKLKKKRRRSEDGDGSSSRGGDASKKRRVKTEGSSSSSTGRKKSSSSSSRAKSPAPKKRTVKRESDSTPRKRATKKKAAAKKEVKKLTWEQKVDRAIMAYKWWEAERLRGGARWRSLEHCGVMFPPDYEPHGVKMLYDNEPVSLPPNAEELATFYAQVATDGPQLGKPKIAKLFNKNFFEDFKRELGPGHVIKKFDKCNFDPIRRWVKEQKEIKDSRSKAEKEVIKKKNQKAKALHMYAFVDGHIEKLANCMVEPPNLFRGRGEHPKTGTYKRRVMPEDITINVSENAVVPACPVPGHAWKHVQHDPKVTWLATWTENVMGQHKYVFLAASSGFKGESDLKKYEKARKLKKFVGTIRKEYTKMMKSKDELERQMGTAMWVIDVLALRVGNEKDDDEADTVGCCSLRVEHLEIGDHSVTFDFLGKDSMRYFETIDFERYGDVGKLVLSNVRRFCSGKKPSDDVFNKLTPTTLNKRLNDFMPGLSAKVFRTYNASVTLEKELTDCEITKTTQEKGVLYDAANREVAILCNHQRTVPKSFEATFAKLEERKVHMEQQLKELKRMRKQIASGEEVRLQSETDDKEQLKRENHRFKRQPSAEQVQKRIATFMDRLKKLKLNMKQKDDNKQVALGTAKINYMDPRITVAWCKRVSCPIEKVFSKALRDKFPWAMSAAPDFKF